MRLLRCPVCEQDVDSDTPGILVAHIFDEHPTSDTAANLMIETAFLGVEV